MNHKIKKIFIFLYSWFTTGLLIGTFTLLGPIHFVTNFGREKKWLQDQEDKVITIIIFLFLFFSILIARRVTRHFFQLHKLSSRLSFILAIGFFSIGAVGFWIHPEWIPFSRNSDSGTTLSFQKTEFTFGPYPSREDLKKLKKEGFTTVVSLLHPAVIPFEAKMILNEEENAKEIGIRLVNVPMLPWVSKNEASLQKIKILPQIDGERYYVHCNLGADRSYIVRRVLEKNGAIVRNEEGSKKKIANKDSFERGKIFKLEEGVHFISYPTDDELFAFILNGNIKSVVSLLDPKNTEETDLINNEKDFLKKYEMSFYLFPIPTETFKENTIEEAVRKTRELPRPIVIHEYRSDSPISQAFMKLYRNALEKDANAKNGSKN